MKVKGLENVLSLVNDARKVLGLKPIDDLPEGKKEEGNSCPIANALVFCLRVDEDYVTFDDEMMAEHVCDVWKVDHAILTVWPILADRCDVWTVDGWRVAGITKGWSGIYKVSTPSEIAFFINDFDNNAYPEYEKKEWYEGEI